MTDPRTYYNEIDPYCAQWLKNLIQAKLIAPGDVDTRDIRDVVPTDLAPYTQCHFFAGIGGWPHALRLAAVPDHFPVWTGSCPCQPFSQAGKRRGFADERHLWPHWFHLISVCRPSTILGEQVAKAADWLRLVRGDLEAVGYAVGAVPIEAASAGADQLRDRFWFVAKSDGGNAGPEWQQRSWQQRQFAPDGVAMAHGNEQRINGSGPRGAGRFEFANRSYMGSGSGSGTRLAFGSQPEIFGGNVWHQGATVGEAGARSGAMADPNSSRDEHGLRLRLEQRSGLSDPARRNGGESDAGRHEWVLGADGKARRVKPGIRLLAHDVPARVAKLRAFGNAIVPQCAAQFIKAALNV